MEKGDLILINKNNDLWYNHNAIILNIQPFNHENYFYKKENIQAITVLVNGIIRTYDNRDVKEIDQPITTTTTSRKNWICYNELLTQSINISKVSNIKNEIESLYSTSLTDYQIGLKYMLNNLKGKD